MIEEAELISARQRGDFQTPAALAHRVWATLDAAQYDAVVEPTFGGGSFFRTLPKDCKAGLIGWEVHEDYYRATAKYLQGEQGREIRLFHRDVFTASTADLGLPFDSSVLVIGNPPWVTNAEQSVLGGRNTGRKHNVKSLSGMDALTGKSNFDISEAIILHLVRMLSDYNSAQFALLVKFSVLRNLMHFLRQCPNIGRYEFHRIDSLRYFGAAVDAGLLKFRIENKPVPAPLCPIYDDVGGTQVGEIGWLGQRFVYDAPTYQRVSFMERLEAPAYVWRQGMKHDLSRVFELRRTSHGLVNQAGEPVDVEPEALCDFYKSSDVFHGRPPRYVIPLYQRTLQDTLEDLPERYPRLSRYLNAHEADFRARKSKIYQDKHPFSVFGIGEYTHAAYKVAIGALYGEPVFRLLHSDTKPVVVDDTCYMLATDDRDEAVYLLAVLSLPCAADFLRAVSHASDKRRYSKEVLSRLLIPPFRDCPRQVTGALSEAWLTETAFPQDAMADLRSWLEEYAGESAARPKHLVRPQPPQQYALFVKEAGAAQAPTKETERVS